MSSLFTRFKRLAGIDIRSDKYTYAKDPTFGYTAASRIPERWVKTTCGYCSVGCGMLLGVRDNQAVAARGNPDHPVNRGKLCPKGGCYVDEEWSSGGAKEGRTKDEVNWSVRCVPCGACWNQIDIRTSEDARDAQ